VELCEPTTARRARLRQAYGFECDCSRCVEGLCGPGGVDIDVVLVSSGAAVVGAEDAHLAPMGLASAEAASAEATSMASASTASALTAPAWSAPVSSSPTASSSSAAADRSSVLLEAAARELDEQTELRLTLEALALRRESCHALSRDLYDAETRALTIALACGELEAARGCCRAAVRFLEATLAHVPAHPLLALQRFTLADLENECGDAAAALEAMEACAAALELTAPTRSSLREQAAARLGEMRQELSG